MSARYLPREFGVVITCNVDGCTEHLRTAVVLKKANRAYAKSLGWIRGGLPGKKRWDICPTHAPAHREEVDTARRERAARMKARDEARKLRFASKEEQAAAKARKRAERFDAAWGGK